VRRVLMLGLLALAAAALAILLQSGARRSGTNFALDGGYEIYLPPGHELCQPGELVPDRTAGIRVDAKAPGGRSGALTATVLLGRRTVASGRLASGWPNGLVTVPLSSTLGTIAGASVCLRPEGSGAAFGGSVPEGSYVVLVDGKTLGGHVRIEYMRPGRESWLSLAPTIAGRIAVGRSQLVRHWAAVGALLLMLLAVGVAAKTVLAEGSKA
jgi:hypothetical protein